MYTTAKTYAIRTPDGAIRWVGPTLAMAIARAQPGDRIISVCHPADAAIPQLRAEARSLERI